LGKHKDNPTQVPLGKDNPTQVPLGKDNPTQEPISATEKGETSRAEAAEQRASGTSKRDAGVESRTVEHVNEAPRATAISSPAHFTG
jgi:hypothetical protein